MWPAIDQSNWTTVLQFNWDFLENTTNRPGESSGTSCHILVPLLKSQIFFKSQKDKYLAPYELFILLSLVSHLIGCNENVKSGQERRKRSLPQQLHLHIYQEVLGVANFPLQINGTCETVQLAGAKVAPFVAFDDADDNVVTRVDRWRSNAEDLSRSDGVGLEGQLMVRDPQGRVLTVYGVGRTTDPLAVSKNNTIWEKKCRSNCCSVCVFYSEWPLLE